MTSRESRPGENSLRSSEIAQKSPLSASLKSPERPPITVSPNGALGGIVA